MCIIVISAVKAQEPQEAPEDVASIVEKILPIGEQFQNNIPLLNNRFRIDAGVDKVILVFFREFGTQPIVLVKPNGSKLFLDNDSEDDSYQWYESDTYDMIELIAPMPGPWQALGQIMPNSKVMVIADLTLEAEVIPTPVFSGETLKHTAFLRNAGQQVNFKEVRDVVTLSIDFISTNDPDYENFGLGSKNIARFLDDGIALDEVAGDGIFTGDFDLDIPNGEWQPVFSVRTPLFSREQTGDKVLLLPNPIRVSHIADESESGFHRVLVEADPEYIDNESLLLEGTVRSPEGEIERFSLTEIGPQSRELTIVNSAYGIYRISLKAYAQTLNGRDVVLDVPDYSFVTKEPAIEVIEEPSPVQSEKLVEPMIQAPQQAEESNFVFFAILVNVILLIVGALTIFIIADKRKHPDNHLLLKISQRLKQVSLKKKTPA